MAAAGLGLSLKLQLFFENQYDQGSTEIALNVTSGISKTLIDTPPPPLTYKHANSANCASLVLYDVHDIPHPNSYGDGYCATNAEGVC